MSWFDGYIPEKCLLCFQKKAGVWEMREDMHCDDRCDYFLSMFPVIWGEEIDKEKMERLERNPSAPLWHR